MNSLRLYTTLVLVWLAVFSSQAQKETPPMGGTPVEFKLPKRDTKSLNNGLRATLVQYGLIPKVHVSVIIKTGNVHEGPDEVWLADLVGALMEEGTTSMDAREIAQKVASMGGSVNISTGPNTMTISGSVLSEYAADLVRILADIAMNPSFPA
jgi:zinc protease